jgi:aspartyl-tRNA(Asn)/glutamyl-tRNA(Gln) amidotransferase subunit C
MAKVTLETVDHVARLAHLTLTDEERTLFTKQLQQVLAYAESIQALDTSDVPPMSHARTSEIFRDDSVAPCLSRETVLAEAPDGAERLFRVPRVIAG